MGFWTDGSGRLSTTTGFSSFLISQGLNGSGVWTTVGAGWYRGCGWEGKLIGYSSSSIRSKGFLKVIGFPLAVIYVYKTNYFNNQSYSDMKEESSFQGGSYAMLNQYLTDGRYSNEQLYEYLASCRNELLFSHHVYQQSPLHLSPDMIKNMQFPPPHNSQQGVSVDQFEILKRAEQHIFAEVMTITSDIATLQTQLGKTTRETQQNNQKIANMHAYFDNHLCQKAQKEVQLIIDQQKINEVKAKTQEIEQKIQLAQLLNEDLEGLRLQSEMTSLSLKQGIERVKSQMDDSMTLKAKTQLQGEVQTLRKKASQLINKQRQVDCVRKDELLECLQERKALEQELLHQQLEKGQFFQLLNHFKNNFRKVKEKNKQLKQQLAKKGLSIPKVAAVQRQLTF